MRRGLKAVASPGKIVIVGGGINGCATAYYLAVQKGAAVTLIDAVGIAPAASGKAGGFLALDWNDSDPTRELTRKSFALHEELASSLQPPVGYRRLTCEALAASGAGGAPRKPKSVEWADVGILGSQHMGSERTIAQTHPKRLCDALWAESERAGSTLTVGEVEGVEVREVEGRQRVCGVNVVGQGLLAADTVLLAMGPWSPSWLGLPPSRTPPSRRTHSPPHSSRIDVAFLTRAVASDSHCAPQTASSTTR